MRHAQATPVPRPRCRARRRLYVSRRTDQRRTAATSRRRSTTNRRPAANRRRRSRRRRRRTTASRSPIPATNPFVDPRVDNQSTFGLDIDTASYTVARRFIDDGNLPDPASVRVEEFVNYFDQGYAAPEDDAFAIHADGGPTPFLAADETLLRIGIKARDVADDARPPAALTFVIDTSGSMSRENRLELVKQSLGLLVEMLRRDDSIGIVAYGTDARVVLEPTPVRDSEAILSAVDSLQPGGSTNAAAGLELGYEMARGSFVPGGVNRVVIASDGVANVGPTDADTILGRIRDGTETGIQLVAIGVGMGNFNDVLLERLADDGDGFYAYVDDIDEARRVFVADLTGTLQSVALDARAQVDFDRDNVEAYRLVGYENRAIADDEYRNDGVDAGAIGAGHQVTALYAVRLTGERRAGRPDRDGRAALDRPLDEPSGGARPGRPARRPRLDVRWHAGDVQARRARRRDRRAVPGQPVGRHLPPEGRAGRRRRAGERAAEDRGGPRLPGSALEGDDPRTLIAARRSAARLVTNLPCRPVSWRSGAGRRLSGLRRPRRRRQTFLDRLALAPVVRHGIRARREGALATLGVGFAGQQLPGTAGAGCPGPRCRRARRTRRRSPACASSRSTRRGSRPVARGRPRRPRPGAARRRRASSRRPRSR